jgi:hypothetical protein
VWARERRDDDPVEFFANSALREEGFEIERQRDYSGSPALTICLCDTDAILNW